MRKFLLVCLLACIQGMYATAGVNPKATDWLKNKELAFVENKGQVTDTRGDVRPDILYTTDLNGVNVYFRNDAVSYVFSKVENNPRTQQPEITGLYRMDLEFVGANKNVRVLSEQALAGVANFYTATTPDGVQGVKSYRKVVYKNLYNNVDLVFYAATNGAGLKYDFIVHPGGNVNDIQIRYVAANQVRLDNGALESTTPLGNVREDAPYTFTQNNKTRVASQYVLRNGVMSFRVGNYDKSQTLVIDPFTTVAATYYGATNLDQAYGVVVGPAGNTTITGYTQNANFPVTAGAHQGTFAGSNDAFVVQFNPSGGRTWATFYGGTSIDQGNGIAVDGSGNVIIAGVTASQSGIASNGASQASIGGGSDAFVACFNGGTGARVWGTYLGGAQVDQALGIATSSTGDVYVTGVTYSSGFPATNGTFGGSRDAFVAKYNAGGVRQWASFYGGNGIDIANAVTFDNVSGTVMIAGQTASNNGIDVTNSGTSFAGGANDMFVAVLNASTGMVLKGMYSGTTGNDVAYAIRTDNAGNVLVAGSTDGTTTLPGSGQQLSNGGSEDAFISKFNPNTNTLMWATYYGGAGIDRALGIASNTNGDVFVTGLTFSTNFPVPAGALQGNSAGNSDAFIVRLDGSTGKRQDATYYGGSGSDIGRAITTTGANPTRVVVAGQTISVNFPVSNAFQGSRAGNDDAFVLWLNSTAGGGSDPCQTAPVSANCQAGSASITVTVSGNVGNTTASLDGGAPQTVSGGVATFNNVASGSHIVVITDSRSCTANCSATVGGGNPCANFNLTSSNFVNATQPSCNNGSINVIPQGQTGAVNYVWSDGVGGNTATRTGLGAGNFTVTATDANNCTATRSFTISCTGQSSILIRQCDNDANKLIICEDGQVALCVANPVGLQYQWFNGNTPIGTIGATTMTVRTAGAYSVRNFNAPTDVSNVLNVVVNPNPDPSITPGGGSGAICTGTGTGAICGTLQPNTEYELWGNIGGGGAGLIRGPQADPCFSITQEGVWFILFRNFITGCEIISTPTRFSVTQGPQKPVITAAGNTTVCTGTSVQLIRSNQPGFTYQWFRGTEEVGNGNEMSIFVSEQGTYTVRASASNGCTSTSDAINITVGETPMAVVTANGPTSFCNPSNVNVVLTVTQTQGATYRWFNGSNQISTAPALQVMTAGTYYVIVTTSAGCQTISNQVTVRVNSLSQPLVSTSSRLQYCIGESVSVIMAVNNPMPNATYEWFQGTSSTSATGSIYAATQAGDYTVHVRQDECTATSNVITVSVNPRPTATVTVGPPGDLTICEDGFVELIGNSGADLSYQWYQNGVAITNDAMGQVYHAGMVGTFDYSLVVSRMGCQSAMSNATTVTVYPNPKAEIFTPGNTRGICIGQTLTLNACNPAETYPQEDLNYTWRLNGVVIPGAKSCSFEATSPGIYQVRILNIRNGCEELADVSLLSESPAVVSVTPMGVTTFCDGGHVTLHASSDKPGMSYRWFRDGSEIMNSNMQDYNAMMTGEYRVEVTTGACKTLSQGINVNVIPNPNAEITVDGATSFCSNENHTVLHAQQGADAYQWIYAASPVDQPMAIEGATQSSYTITKMGWYWVRVTKDGCTSLTQDAVQISIQNSPTARVMPAGPISRCTGATDVILTANPALPMASYQWLWGATPETASPYPGGMNVISINPRVTGRYWVLITSMDGCSSLSNGVDVIFNPIPAVEITHVPDSIICQDGSVKLMARGYNGNPGATYSFMWMMKPRNGNDWMMIPGAMGSEFWAMEDGWYRAMVVADGCMGGPSNELNVKVHPNPDITITLSGLTQPCEGVTLNAVFDGTFHYQWLMNGIRIPGATNSSYTTSMPANYNVIIKNGITGCEETSIAVTVYPNPVADAGDDMMTCEGVSTMLNGSASGGSGDYLYFWQEPAGLSGTISDPTSATPTVTVNEAGTYVYTLIVTDMRGCISNPVGFVTVTVNENPTANAGENFAICQNGTFTLEGSATGGNGGPYMYVWSGPNGFMADGQVSPNITLTTAGSFTYDLMVTDGNGCVGTSQVEVLVKVDPRIISIAGNPFPNPTATFCFGGNLVLQSTASGDLYNWYRNGEFVQGGIDNKYTAFIGGAYTVEVVDMANNIRCISQTPFIVTVYERPLAQIFPTTDLICPGNPVMLRAAEALGYSFLWLVGNSPAEAVPASGDNTMSTYAATSAGNYWVLVTSAEGCNNLSTPMNVMMSTFMVNSTTVQHPSGCGNSDGVIVANATSQMFPVQYRLGAGAWQATGTFFNLAAGTYAVQIREVGGCSYEEEVMLTVAGPTGLMAQPSSITDNSATITWNFVSGGGVIRYNLRYRVMGAESWTAINNINGTVQVLSNLQQDTDYEVQVQAVCRTLNISSPWSMTMFHTLRTEGTTCDTPSDIYVNIMTAPNGVPTVYWDNVAGAACYDLQYRIVGGSFMTLQLNASQNPFPLTGLEPATDYQVRMRAHCTICNGNNRSAWSPNIRFTTPGDCNPNFFASINNGVSVVDNCGAYMLKFDGEVRANYTFQWRVDGVVIGDAEMHELEITESGNYDLRVKAGNCEEVYSNAVNVTISPIPAVIANTAQNITCISGNDGIIVAGCVDVPGRMCNDNPSGYMYMISGNNGYTSDFQTSGIFTSLREGFYTVTILDLETGCTSTYADADYTTITAPEKAMITTVTPVNAEAALVRWNSVYGANAYVLSYRPEGSGEQNWNDVFFNGGCPYPGECELMVSNLQNGTVYDLRIRTRCALGNILSDWTDTVQFRTPTFAGCPLAPNAVPGGVYAIVTGQFSSTVFWNAVSGASCYHLHYRQAGQDDDQWVEAPAVAGLSATISNLLANTTYEYEVQAICGSNCAGTPGLFSEMRTFTTLFFKGMEDVATSGEMAFKVYPNPNNGSFVVSFDAVEAGSANIRMFDIAGREVLNRTHNTVEGVNEVPVELSGYASGIYLLHFNQGSIDKVVKVVVN